MKKTGKNSVKTGSQEEKQTPTGRAIGYSNLIPGANKNGRPKGKRNFDTLVDLAMEALALEYVKQTNEKNKGKKGYKDISLKDVDIEADIFKQFMNKARNGDIKAIDSFLDRRHGKAKQPVELSGVDGNPIEYSIKVKEFEDSIVTEQNKWFEDDKPQKK